MADDSIDFSNTETVFLDFRLATMQTGGAPYGVLENTAIGVSGGKIQWMREADSLPSLAPGINIVRGGNRWMTPGLVDCHTHLIHGGSRVGEWEARLGGKTYEEIARAGGGILSSVKATRAASEDELVADGLKRLHCLMGEGVTTVEIKSGYGLDLDNELKMLRAANRLGARAGIDVFTTLLGAHAVPPEYKNRVDDYLDLVCNEMIPAAKDICSAVDVFCESIAFTFEQSKRVLQAGLDAGLDIKVHAEQRSDNGMAAEAARMGAVSVDHLEFLAKKDCKVLAKYDTVATLLPGAFYCLLETQKPPVAELIKQGVPMAIATDSNPGSAPFLSLLMIGNLACNLYGLTPEQALAGMTRNGALALGLTDRGVIQPGMLADFVIWDVKTPASLLYQIGGNPCVAVYKNGVLQSPTRGRGC